jgi:cytochrome c-type biogenesis protein CcmH
MTGRTSPFLFAPLLLVLLASGAAAQEERPSVAAPNARAVVGAPSGLPLSGDSLEATTKEVASLLRCPVCQGLSVWDSPATMAVNMKHEVRELLATGYGQDQILRYFEHSYGEFVLLAPSKTGIALLVWVLPVMLLLAGGITVWRMTFSPPASAAAHRRALVELVATDLPERGALPADRELARYVLAVRALAHGKPGNR